MSLSPKNYLSHIRDEAEFLLKVIKDYSQEEFIADPEVNNLRGQVTQSLDYNYHSRDNDYSL